MTSNTLLPYPSKEEIAVEVVKMWSCDPAEANPNDPLSQPVEFTSANATFYIRMQMWLALLFMAGICGGWKNGPRDIDPALAIERLTPSDARELAAALRRCSNLDTEPDIADETLARFIDFLSDGGEVQIEHAWRP